jgi:hypothetical protein
MRKEFVVCLFVCQFTSSNFTKEEKEEEDFITPKQALFF